MDKLRLRRQALIFGTAAAVALPVVCAQPAFAQESAEHVDDAIAAEIENQENEQVRGIEPYTEVAMRINMELEHDMDAPITIKDLEQLTELNLAGAQDQEDWSWIVYCTNLESFDANNSSFKDASLLSGLTNLNKLVLSATELENVEALHTLVNLKELNLSELEAHGEADHDEHGGATVDASFLSGMTKLEKLAMFEVELTNSSALANLTSLKNLDLSYNEDIDTQALAKLTQLEHLYLEDCHIDNVDFVASMPNLVEADLSGNNISDISAFKGLSLRELNLKSNPVSDISALEGMTSLTHLNLTKNSVTDDDHKISDISNLAGLTNLVSLQLGYNKISDVSALKDLAKLENLNLANNQISNVSPLENLSALTTLRLENNKDLSDVSALNKLENLGDLNLSGDALTDLSALQNPKSIFILNVGDQSASFKKTIAADKLDGTTLLEDVLIELPNKELTYTLNHDEGQPQASIKDGALVLPKGFDIANPTVVNFTQEVKPNTHFAGTLTYTLLAQVPEKPTQTSEAPADPIEKADAETQTDKAEEKPTQTVDAQTQTADAQTQTDLPENEVVTKKEAASKTVKVAHTLPQTGDLSSLAGVAALGISGLGALLLGRKRK